MHKRDNGLDAQGFIRNDCSPENIQIEFQPVVEVVVGELITQLPKQIDGIYLYGSVPRGTAMLGHSDLDVSVILTAPVSQNELGIFKQTVFKHPQSLSANKQT